MVPMANAVMNLVAGVMYRIFVSGFKNGLISEITRVIEINHVPKSAVAGLLPAAEVVHDRLQERSVSLISEFER